jgi:response regulator of citrate/malate metabolism
MPYKVLIVEDQDMPRELFEIYINSSENFEHLLSVSNASARAFRLQKQSGGFNPDGRYDGAWPQRA